MIRMLGHNTKTKRPMIILGLSDNNIKALRDGKPIHIHADDMGYPGEIIIFTGKTEDDMAKMILENFEVGRFDDHRKKKRN